MLHRVFVNAHGEKAAADLRFVAVAQHVAVFGRTADVEGVFGIPHPVVAPALVAELR